MEIGTFVNWIQLGLWLVAAILFAGRLLKEKPRMPKWFSSNTIIGAVIALGLIATGISFYVNYKVFRPGSLEGVTISVYGPDATALSVVSNETFDNADIPLDGHSYNNVTFINCCLLYDGGSYQLQNVTLKDHWRVCVKDERLKNYASLVNALKLNSPGTRQSERTVVVPKQLSPQPSN